MIKAGDFVVYDAEIYKVADAAGRFVLLETPKGLRGEYTPVHATRVKLWRETVS